MIKVILWVRRGNNSDITERVQANEKLAHYADQLETLNKVIVALSSTLDLNGLLGLILDQIGKIVALDSSTIFLYEENGLRAVADRGITPSNQGRFFTNDDISFEKMKKTHKPVILNHLKR